VPDRVMRALQLNLPIVLPLRGRTELVGVLLVDGAPKICCSINVA